VAYLPGFCIGVFCVLTEGICDLAGPVLLAAIVDKGVKSGSLPYIFRLSAMMLAIALLGALFAAGRNVSASIVSRGFGANLRMDLFNKMLKMSAAAVDRTGQSSLITRMTNDVTQIIQYVNSTMRMAIKAPIVCIGSIVMAFILSPYLSIPVILSVIAGFLLIFACLKAGYAKFYAVQKAIDRVATVTQENLKAVRLVKAFGGAEYEEIRFSAANNELGCQAASANRVLSVLTPFIALSINLGTVFVIYIGSLLLTSGKAEIGIIMAFTTYMAQILLSIMSISNAFNTFARTKASSLRIAEVLDEEEENDGISDTIRSIDSGIAFKNVTFYYPGSSEEPALKEISFTCETGKVLSVLGATGSGKTTIVSLLLGFYMEYEGEITIGETNLKSLSLTEIRNMIGVVPQRNMMFSGTISDNIRWGKQGAQDVELQQAAKTAKAHDFITSMPNGYDSLVTQGAANLSGGQKQRLSIARAAVKKPEIFIFDDCTSALDVITEKRVLHFLKSEFPHVTKIIITQRIATALKADKILVLDNGQVAGEGNHNELMESCEIYRDIYISQMGRDGVTVER
jgi:ATP-binding cassette subfamily B protein